jgi:hypothetical protein
VITVAGDGIAKLAVSQPSIGICEEYLPAAASCNLVLHLRCSFTSRLSAGATSFASTAITVSISIRGSSSSGPPRCHDYACLYLPCKIKSASRHTPGVGLTAEVLEGSSLVQVYGKETLCACAALSAFVVECFA